MARKNKSRNDLFGSSVVDFNEAIRGNAPIEEIHKIVEESKEIKKEEKVDTVEVLPNKDIKKRETEIETNSLSFSQEKAIVRVPIGMTVSAPKEWKKFSMMRDANPAKFIEMVGSFYSSGGNIEPCHVWKRPDGTLMMLAGYNREDIVSEIRNNFSAYPQFGITEQEAIEKFSHINCVVYEEDEITEVQARAIFLDTNGYRRVDTRKEKNWFVTERAKLYRKQGLAKGEAIVNLMKTTELKKSALYEELAVGEKLNKELQELYYDGKFDRKSAFKLSNMRARVQQEIADKYKDKLNNESISKLKANFDEEEVRDVLEGPLVKMKNFQLQIPETLEEEFRDLLKQFYKQHNMK